MRISFTKRSTNLKHEYENYAWKRRKESVEEDDHLGIEDPTCANHLMSAIRYGFSGIVAPAPELDYWDKMWKDELDIKVSKKKINLER